MREKGTEEGGPFSRIVTPFFFVFSLSVNLILTQKVYCVNLVLKTRLLVIQKILYIIMKGTNYEQKLFKKRKGKNLKGVSS